MATHAPTAPPTARTGWAVLLVLALLFGASAFFHFYVEFRWFASLGHSEVLTYVLGAKVATGLAVFVFFLAMILVHLRIASSQVKGLSPLHLHDPDGFPRIDLHRIARRLVLPYAVIVSSLYGFANSERWTEPVLFANGGSFGSHDPLFGNDVGFYIFKLPLLESVASLVLWALLLSLVGVLILYGTSGALVLSERGVAIHSRARAHVATLIALIFVVQAGEALLDMYRLLYSQLGPMTGASYADVHARLPALRIKAGLCGVSAVLAMMTARRQGLGLLVLAAVLYFVGQLGVGVFTNIVHRFSVIPNELEKERPFLAYNIEATRAAYGLDRVVERDLSGDRDLTAEDIDRNADTIDNIRLWDHQPLLDSFAQIQEIRTYYDFKSVDNDRYIIDGQLRQVMLSPRELSAASLPSRTWVNERFTFTHGYGLALGPVNEATPEGLPELFVQDIPPVSIKKNLRITQPSIYFGELSNDHVFVRTQNREFDYPSGEGYVQTDYSGRDGLRFDSFLTRLAVASDLRSMKVLLSNDIDSDSRVLLHRNIIDRVRRVIPFAFLDDDPYMIVRENGTLMWICDAYLASDRYPYSESAQGTRANYIRNSLKVTVDAYQGTVTVYAVDTKDPLLRAWKSFLPHTFKTLSKMPKDVRAHLRYPERIFQIQTAMFATYHMREADLLYNREDQWEIPAIGGGEGSVQTMEPYYAVMSLPGESKAEFILMLPFTPKRKDNLSAWMVARSDGDHLGELVVYRFPKDRLVFGPQQIVNRINQDAEISRQISLWDQRGSAAIFGTLLVIPVEESLLYVRPLYLRSEGGKIPELKRVIVAYEKQIAMAPSLKQALAAVFGSNKTPAQATESAGNEPVGSQAQESTPESTDTSTEAQSTPEPSAPAAAALLHFERALKAQRAGDWATYGSELKLVEEQLRAMQPATNTQSPTKQ